MSAPIVEISNLRKSFPESFDLLAWLRYRTGVPQRRVLSEVSFDVARGEVLGLLGANGAGKTTLLKLIAAIMMPTAGSIRIDGVDTQRQPMQARRAIGFAPTDHRSFYYRLTAMENLQYFGTMCGVPRALLRERIAAAVRAVDLSEDLGRKFSKFSTGMRHRLTIARALLHDPPVLLLDEPTHALDPTHAAQIRTLIRDRLTASGKTIVVSTNVLDEAWQLCDRVAVLREGRIVALDAPSRLRHLLRVPPRYRITIDRYDEQLVERLRAALHVHRVDASLDGAQQITIELAPDADLNAMLTAASSNGVRIRRVEPLDPRPAEVFSSIVGVDQ